MTAPFRAVRFVPLLLRATLRRLVARHRAGRIEAPDGAISVVVASEDVTQTKPSPEPYLRAAELLGVRIEQRVAVEDSPHGLASAIASSAASRRSIQHAAMAGEHRLCRRADARPEDGRLTAERPLPPTRPRLAHSPIRW